MVLLPRKTSRSLGETLTPTVLVVGLNCEELIWNERDEVKLKDTNANLGHDLADLFVRILTHYDGTKQQRLEALRGLIDKAYVIISKKNF